MAALEVDHKEYRELLRLFLDHGKGTETNLHPDVIFTKAMAIADFLAPDRAVCKDLMQTTELVVRIDPNEHTPDPALLKLRLSKMETNPRAAIGGVLSKYTNASDQAAMTFPLQARPIHKMMTKFPERRLASNKPRCTTDAKVPSL